MKESRVAAGPFIQTDDGVSLFYQDWGSGKAIVFVTAWAMSSDEWQYNFEDFCEGGFRCVSFDRRGHGRSGRPRDGYVFDRLVDDLATVIDALDLREVTLLGHSLGGMEAVGYLAKHGSKRVTRLVLLAPTTPFMTMTADNPDGLPRTAHAMTHALWRKDFPAWLNAEIDDFYRHEPRVSQGIVDWTIDMMRATPLPVALQCGAVVAETDLRAALRRIDVPTLIIHGDADASIPVALGRATAKLIPNATYIEYKGAPHGLFYTHRERILGDVRAWLGGEGQFGQRRA